MYPMDFEEFCWAMGDEVTVPAIREHFESLKPLGEDIHASFMDTFRKYMIVGGMPMAVEEYASTSDFAKVERIKRQIIRRYRDEIGELNKSRKRKTSALYEAIPGELSKRNKTFNLADIVPNGKFVNYEDPIHWLEDSMIVNACYNSGEPSTAFGLDWDPSTMKFYSGDTGLLVSMAIDTGTSTENEIYIDILQDRLHLNEGMFAENIVAQMLKANGHRLFFHAFYKNGSNGSKSRNRCEVDFLIKSGRKISAVEVKTGRSTDHASLDYLLKKYTKQLEQCYVLHTKDLRKEGNLLYLPIYMAICL